MQKKTKILLLLFVLLIPPLAYIFFTPTITGASVMSLTNGQPPAPITLPYSQRWSKDFMKLRYQVNLHYKPWQSGRFAIIADDCTRAIIVNGQPVDLQGRDTCNIRRGMEIDLSAYLHSGDNTLIIEAENLLVSYTLDVRSLPLYFGHLWIIGVYFLAIVAGIYTYVLRGRRDLLAIGLVGVTLLAVCLIQRYPLGSTYDLDRHGFTVVHYAQNFSIPAPEPGREYHQPPLYYALAGLVYRLAEPFGQSTVLLYVIALSYLLYSLTLLYGILTMRISIPSKRLQQVGALALMLWPSGILHASRISNDILLYLGFAGAFYHWLRWHRTHHTRQLTFTLLWVAASFATKNSAIVLPLILGGISLSRGRLMADAQATLTRSSRIACVLLVLALAASFGRTFYYAVGNPQTSFLEGKPEGLSKFGFHPETFFTFAAYNYIEQPYVRFNWLGVTGTNTYNELYWNFFLRTLFYGEYSWAGVTHASIMNVCLLGMFAWLGASVATSRRFGVRAGSDALIAFACCLLASMGARIYFSDVLQWADGRHMHHLIIFFITAYMCKWADLRRRLALSIPGAAFMLVYIACAIFHFWMQISYSINGASPFDLSWRY